jgi:hypothetical protein
MDNQKLKEVYTKGRKAGADWARGGSVVADVGELVRLREAGTINWDVLRVQTPALAWFHGFHDGAVELWEELRTR